MNNLPPIEPMPLDADEEILKAVALYYPGDEAPQVTAKGCGKQAEEIIEIAREHNVTLCDNPALAEMLSQLELGDTIPESLYVVIAHIIAFAYKIQLDLYQRDTSLNEEMDIPPS